MNAKVAAFGLSVLGVFSWAGPATAGEPGKVLGCPGENVTISSGINVRETVCLKFYSVISGEPTTAKFWDIGLLGNRELGTHTGSACFDFSGPKYELRVGEISAGTTFYVFVNDTESWYRYTLPQSVSGVILHPAAQISNNPGERRIDPCRPECLQTEPPPLPGAAARRGDCHYDCYTNGRSGVWELVCNGMIFDPITGRPRPAP